MTLVLTSAMTIDFCTTRSRGEVRDSRFAKASAKYWLRRLAVFWAERLLAEELIALSPGAPRSTFRVILCSSFSIAEMSSSTVSSIVLSLSAGDGGSSTCAIGMDSCTYVLVLLLDDVGDGRRKF